MAYKQSPGRQAMPKTGRGLSPTLMSESPMKQTLSAQGVRSRARVLATEEKRMQLKNDNIVIDPITGLATAAPYPNTFLGGQAESSNKKVPTGKRTNAMIINKSGKKVKEANRGKGFSNEKLYQGFKSDSTNVMNANNRAARFYNVQTGRAQATPEELASGQARTFFAKNQGQ
jgi:myo-inositol-hexaphosphate 3-phosphohydrolase